MNITICPVFVANYCYNDKYVRIEGELKKVIFFSFILVMMIIRTDQYVSMEEEEFKLSEDDIKWLLSHTEYDDKELNTMLAGEVLIIDIILEINNILDYDRNELKSTTNSLN